MNKKYIFAIAIILCVLALFVKLIIPEKDTLSSKLYYYHGLYYNKIDSDITSTSRLKYISLNQISTNEMYAGLVNVLGGAFDSNREIMELMWVKNNYVNYLWLIKDNGHWKVIDSLTHHTGVVF